MSTPIVVEIRCNFEEVESLKIEIESLKVMNSCSIKEINKLREEIKVLGEENKAQEVQLQSRDKHIENIS